MKANPSTALAVALLVGQALIAACHGEYAAAHPLADPAVPDFSGAYSGLSEADAALQRLLRERPARASLSARLPQYPYMHASEIIRSKYQYVSFQGGEGILYLTQWAQDDLPSPVNNEELTLVFKGRTTNGRYYVEAQLPITHPSLPAGIDSTRTIVQDKNRRYLRTQESALDGFDDESFRPSLKVLRALINSLSVAD